MSSHAIFEKLAQLDEGMKNLGNPAALKKLFGTTADGRPAIVLNLSKASGAWASLDLKVIVVATPAGFGDLAAFKTQSHASGEFIDGSYSFEVWMEGQDLSGAPSTAKQALAKFESDIVHVLRGQNGAPVNVMLTQGAEPTVNGVDGAVASVGALWARLMPYGRSFAGGV